MTRLPTHEKCGGKLVLPTAIYKDDNNKPVAEKTIIRNIEFRWCTKCKSIVQIEVVQK
jgi:hypothetical protein